MEKEAFFNKDQMTSFFDSLDGIKAKIKTNSSEMDGFLTKCSNKSLVQELGNLYYIINKSQNNLEARINNRIDKIKEVIKANTDMRATSQTTAAEQSVAVSKTLESSWAELFGGK